MPILSDIFFNAKEGRTQIIWGGRWKDSHLFLRNKSKSVTLHKAGIALMDTNGDILHLGRGEGLGTVLLTVLCLCVSLTKFSGLEEKKDQTF